MSEEVLFFDNIAAFNGSVKTPVAKSYFQFVEKNLSRAPRTLYLDFTECTGGYPNTMLPIIASTRLLTNKGNKIKCILPKEEEWKRLFLNANWAHYLSPYEYSLNEADWAHHLPTVNYLDGNAQYKVCSEFADVFLRTLDLDINQLRGLQFAIAEITDNVLSHSESQIGGFVQVTKLREKIDFCVVDGGVGILSTLRTAYPELRSDEDAIRKAVLPNVTRGLGKGRGLAGTLGLAQLSAGSFRVASGTTEVIWHPSGESEAKKMSSPFFGTIVDVQISLSTPININQVFEKALGVSDFVPEDIIRSKYTLDDINDDSRRVVLRNEPDGLTSRVAGIRTLSLCRNLLKSDPTQALILDWTGVNTVSNSYADEVIGKLYQELGSDKFRNKIQIANCDESVRSILNSVIPRGPSGFSTKD